MPRTNAHVARTLRHVADLLERTGDDRFRVRAWRRAARTLEALVDPVEDRVRAGRGAVLELPGVGPRLAGAIEEIVRTGTLRGIAVLREKAPPPWSELARVPGLGRAKAKRLAAELGVSSLAELRDAARAGRVRALRGFGPASERRILEGIEATGTTPARVHRALAERSALPLLAAVREIPCVVRAELAGSLRRRAATVGDVDIVCAAEDPAAALAAFEGLLEVMKPLGRDDSCATVRLGSGLEASLVAVTPQRFGASLYACTGSAAHLAALGPRLAERSLALDHRGLRRRGRFVVTRDEEAVARALDLPLVPPELREGREEIDAAAAGRLPRLVEVSDVRGDLQVHSTDTDGHASLEEMAEAARARGLEYMAFTDHTESLRIASGMGRAGFVRQMRRIDALNARRQGFRVLKGAEVDILRDGSLDLDDATLTALDIVLVSIHTHFDLPREEQTRRVLRAISHPSVDVFAHPRGRRIGRRPGADFDLPRVAREAARRGVLLEANATPERQDLDDEGVRIALEAGATLIVSTDAHSPGELAYLRFGVDQLRRGGAESRHVANTRPLPAFLGLLHARRRLRA